MTTTYSPLSEADDSKNQKAQVITDLQQDLKNTVNAQNMVIQKLEDDNEEQNTNILQLEGDIEEQNAINLKLEGNILEQQNHTILQLEDNIAFSLAHQNYFGDKLKDESDRIKRIRVNDTFHYRIYGVPIRLFAVLVISAVVFGGWAYFVIGQRSGTFFHREYKRKYPKCDVANPTLIGDGTCHGGAYNTKKCGYDGGDCTNFNTRYPDCTVEDPTFIGDGECDGESYNTAACRFDGGDCIFYPDCDVDNPSFLGDGRCHGDNNTPECGFDGGDCVEFNSKYPDCNVNDPSAIGDGYCDNEREYNAKECGFDGGDCIGFNKLLYPDCNIYFC